MCRILFLFLFSSVSCEFCVLRENVIQPLFAVKILGQEFSKIKYLWQINLYALCEPR